MKRASICILLCVCLIQISVVSASAAASSALVPVGQAVGLELESDGLYLVRLDEQHPAARDAGLKVGDRILTVNGSKVRHVEELREIIRRNPGARLIVDVDRASKAMSFTILPVLSEEGWVIGASLQERVSGLGTLTYYDPESGRFGALGHGVTSCGVGSLMKISGGTLREARVTAVEKGLPGKPGSLKGDALGQTLGGIDRNTSQGVFGTAEAFRQTGDAIPVASHEEVTVGPAEIWSTVGEGSMEHFQIRIEALTFDSERDRNLLISVTDPALLEKTGGIVQGMSGSPIEQNGKLVGAVTHVLVQDPSKGYGIFIENMLESSPEADFSKAA